MGIPRKPKNPAWGFRPKEKAAPATKGLGLSPVRTVEDGLKRILGVTFGFDEGEISLATTMRELEFDSLDFVEFAECVEEVFRVGLPEAFDLEELRTVGDWLREIERRAAEEGVRLEPVEG